MSTKAGAGCVVAISACDPEPVPMVIESSRCEWRSAPLARSGPGSIVARYAASDWAVRLRRPVGGRVIGDAMGSIEDRFAIMELLARYASIPDEKNFDGVFDVFTESVRWDFGSLGGGPESIMSPADIKAWLLPTFTGFVATHHAITNHRIAVDGDRATIRAHIHAEHWIDPAEAGDGPQCWVAVGFYDDEAVRTPDGWRLSAVRLTMTHSTGGEVVPIAIEVGQRILAAAAEAGT